MVKTPALVFAFLMLACTASPTKEEVPQQPHQATPTTTSKWGAYAIDREEGERLAAAFGALEKFPIPLSELEKVAGRSLKENFSPETKSAGFEHDGRGPIGPNVGGRPIDHDTADAPMLLEIRSRYYAKYDDERRFDRKPPFAADDPVIDRIEISGAYARGAALHVDGLARFDNEIYPKSGEFWRMKRVPLGPRQKHQGFLSVVEKTPERRSKTERWHFVISTDRGVFHDDKEVKEGLAPLLELIAAIESGEDFAPLFTAWKAKYKGDEDLTSFDFGLMTHNPRYFNAKFKDGDYKGDFLDAEGRKASLYVDSYVKRDAHVTLPALFKALKMSRSTVDPKSFTGPSPGIKKDNGIAYYNTVKRSRATGASPCRASIPPKTASCPSTST